MVAPASFLSDRNQVNAIYRPAAGCETLCCGFNQGIYLGGIETGTTSIQFKIGFHDQDCFHTSLSISIVVQMFLTLGLSTGMEFTPAFTSPYHQN